MQLTFAPNDVLQIEGARIVYRNFAGEGSRYNREGDRNFALVIPDQDMAEELRERGWNVKIRPPREDGDDPFMYLQVKVKFNTRGPIVRLVSGRSNTILSEDTIKCLDDILIEAVDMHIRPYDWERPDGSGRSAYLQAMRVFQRIEDPYADDYDEF